MAPALAVCIKVLGEIDAMLTKEQREDPEKTEKVMATYCGEAKGKDKTLVRPLPCQCCCCGYCAAAAATAAAASSPLARALPPRSATTWGLATRSRAALAASSAM